IGRRGRAKVGVAFCMVFALIRRARAFCRRPFSHRRSSADTTRCRVRLSPTSTAATSTPSPPPTPRNVHTPVVLLPLAPRSRPARRPLAACSKVLGSGGEHLRATHDQPLSDPVAAASPQVTGLFVVTPRPTDVGDRISADLAASLPVPLR